MVPKTGEPVSVHQYDLETNRRTLVVRDYQYYYDCTISRLYYDEENEIYKMHPNWFHEYGHGTFYPDIFNSAYNQGDPGRYYSEHDGYYKGKPGYIITWGQAEKHDVSHQFCSDVDEDSRDDALASAAVKEKLHKFEPKAYAYLSDMRYESNRKMDLHGTDRA